MKKWVCTVCGYVHEGDTPPEKCPTCGVPAEKFKEQTGEREWAALSTSRSGTGSQRRHHG